MIDFIQNNVKLNIINGNNSLNFESINENTLHIFLNQKNAVDLIELNESINKTDKFIVSKENDKIIIIYTNYHFVVDESLNVKGYDDNNDLILDLSFDIGSTNNTILNVDETIKVFGLGDKMNYLNKAGYAYESWATDDSKHHNESFKSLYKAINYLLLKGKNEYLGFFFPSTYKYSFDLCKSHPNKIIISNKHANPDFYLFVGNDVKNITSNYSNLVGHPYLIRYKMLGNNQSRFTYKSSEEVMRVVDSYYENKLPLDYIHLDIEYMDGFRDFTVNQEKYPSLRDLTTQMKNKGVELIVINDAGIKQDPFDKIYSYLSKNSLLGKLDGKTYINVVWPGESAFPNYFDDRCKKFINTIAEEFVYEHNISGIWNDMNEPASFNGELPLNVDFSFEGRTLYNEEAHNVYAEHMVKSLIGIYEKKNVRPYIFSRAAFATTAKYAFVWNGDNASLWHHLKLSIPQILSMSLSNFMINGVDIGGFNEDVTKELLCRWIESSTFTPFMRNHSSINTKNQEPFAFDKELMDIYRKYLQIRYQFAPYMYNLVYRMSINGELINAPMFYYWQDDENAITINDQYMVGPNVMVAPILEKETDRRIVYFPDGEWVDLFTGEKYLGKNYYLIQMNLDECGIYIKNNSLIPLIPITNSLDKENNDQLIIKIVGEEGTLDLYDDDGVSLDYQKGIYNMYHISYKDNMFVFETKHKKYDATYKTICIEKNEIKKTIPFEYSFKLEI